MLHLRSYLMQSVMRLIFVCILFLFLSCKENKSSPVEITNNMVESKISYARGFTIQEAENGVKYLNITSPWPDSEMTYKYALVPRDRKVTVPDQKDINAIIYIPVERIIATSTTHIPALEALGIAEKLIGFPETKYVSSPITRERIESGEVVELGSNEALNTEMAIAVAPDLVVGFGIDNQNKAYSAIERAGIPVVYNGDWTEESPLGKAEWIKFFAVFNGLDRKADSIFREIEEEYIASRELAKTVQFQPSVLSGALYKDVWYLPAGESWAARFIEDANGKYLWGNTPGTGSLSLSIEAVLNKATVADLWISPSQFTSYDEMATANDHYLEFKAFREKKLFTFARTRGATGGLLYYELGPSRPDMVLKDLIHIFHPQLMPEHKPFFFKPLK